MLECIIALAQTLKSARVAKGLSQAQLAQKIGIPQSHLSKIENGQVNLKLTSLVELARALELELMLVPRQKVGLVQALLRYDGEKADSDLAVKPAYSLDDEPEGGDE